MAVYAPQPQLTYSSIQQVHDAPQSEAATAGALAASRARQTLLVAVFGVMLGGACWQVAQFSGSTTPIGQKLGAPLPSSILQYIFNGVGDATGVISGLCVIELLNSYGFAGAPPAKHNARQFRATCVRLFTAVLSSGTT